MPRRTGKADRPPFEYTSRPDLANSGINSAVQQVYVPWIEMTDSSNRVTARYAYWIEDESFKANSSHANSNATRRDNTASNVTAADPLAPKDVSLLGTLIGLNKSDAEAQSDASVVTAARAVYPGGLFPEPRALAHSVGGGAGAVLPSTTVDGIRYLTTPWSGALNLSRHGTQRVNVNKIVSTTNDRATIQRQVDQLVQTLRFHVPLFGQRFYRASATNPSLNAVDVTSQNATIYLYKLVANLRDYIDTDSQPTIIDAPAAQGAPALVHPLQSEPVALGPPTGAGPNTVWAFGKITCPISKRVSLGFGVSVARAQLALTLMN